MKLENYSIINWIIKNKIKTEDGSLYEFRNYMFMYDVLRDMAGLKKDLVCFKAAQIGFSTAAILSTMWIAKNRRIDEIYTLPTNADVEQFAGGKINRMIAQNPVLQEWVKEKDTVQQKEVGDNIIYYRGTFSQKAAMMVSSDLNCYDEEDASKPDVIEQYATRLQASSLKREWHFSHPSTEGTGVAKHWGKSDQKHWFIKCSHCEKEQFLDWPASFDINKELYICKHCKGEIYDDDRRRGRWVVKFKDREMSGYWIPLFICPWVTAAEIIKYYNNKTAEYFTNKVLGLPYVGGGNKLTKNLLMQNLTEEVLTPAQSERVVIGIDTGNDVHYVVGGESGLFFYDYFSKGELNSSLDKYEEIIKLMERWPRAIIVIDQGGDLLGSRALRAKYPGRVFLCSFGSDRNSDELFRWGKNEEIGAVIADRNRTISLVVEEFTDKRIPIQGTENDWHDYWLHWNNLSKIKEFDQTTGQVKRKVWVRSGADHWALATTYWRVGMGKFSGKGYVIHSDSMSKIKEVHSVNPDDTIAFDKSIFKFKKPKKDWRKR